ncbi:MAG: hypothetical protein H0T10_08390 [Actinobacteria bacterium]|nr:hypothetical protein [Actinomycetota bacterium]
MWARLASHFRAADDSLLEETQPELTTYDRRIDPVLVIAAASLLLIVLGVARVAWRFLHDNEEPQAGGSMGRQLFGRTKKRAE